MIKKITSTANEIVKTVKAYKEGKSDYVILDGIKLITDAINNGLVLSQLFIESSKVAKYQYLIKPTIDCFEASENVLNVLASSKTPQGVVGVAEFKDKDIQKPNGNFLILDGIQDPGNLETIIRSALGANFLDIYCIDCVNYKLDKVIRSSMASLFSVNIYKTTSKDMISLIKTWKTPLYCANMAGENLFKFEPAPKFGLVIGSEGQGVSKELESACDKTLAIPMNKKLESLNAGVSASIIMYNLTNKGV